MLAIEAKIMRMKRESRDFKEILYKIDMAVFNGDDWCLHHLYNDEEEITKIITMLELMGYEVYRLVEEDDYNTIRIEW